MELKCERILDVFLYNNKAVLCQIQIVPHKEEQQEDVTCRRINAKQWKAFDSELEALIGHDPDNCFRRDSEKTFRLDGSTRVRVRKSRISVRALCQCVAESNLNAEDVVLALECCIEHDKSSESCDSTACPTFGLINSPCRITNALCEPCTVSIQKCTTSPSSTGSAESVSPNSGTEDTNSTRSMMSDNRDKGNQTATIMYESNRPKDGRSILKYNEEDIDRCSNSGRPQYSNCKVKCRKSSKLKDDKVIKGEDKSEIKERSSKEYEKDRVQMVGIENICLKRNVYSADDFKKIPIEPNHEDNMENGNEVTKGNKVKIGGKGDEQIGGHSNRNRREIKGPISESSPACAFLRRSARSPVKPKRLIEETNETGVKNQILKTHHRIKDTISAENKDYDSNHEAKDLALKSPKLTHKKESSSDLSLSSSKKRHKANRHIDYKREAYSIDKWLSKKTTNKISTDLSKEYLEAKPLSRVKSPPLPSLPIPHDIVLPSKYELETLKLKQKLQHEENIKLKAELDKMNSLSPAEVVHLSLDDMSLSELLATFGDHQKHLDKIFDLNRQKDHIKGHDGVNHCLVIRLIDQHKQLKMLNWLSDKYTNRNNTTDVTLYANALLPEWIIRIFMEKYNFTRNDAISHVKAQDAYKLHLDAQLDDLFSP